jgi:excisionase family DNA binding protein
MPKAAETNRRRVTEAEAAVYLGVKPQTLAVWRSTQRYALPFYRVGRAIRYDTADLDAFLESRRCGGEKPDGRGLAGRAEVR